MNNINFYIPIELNALPEYLSSGFIGLTSSKDDSIKDKQSLTFPFNIGLKDLNSVQTESCIEVSIPAEKCIEDGAIIQTKTPTPISKIVRVIFFSEEGRGNFLASYTPFKEIPIDFFTYELANRSINLNPIVDISKVKIRKKRVNFTPNTLHSLLVAIVNSSHWLNQKASLNYEVTLPKSKLKKNEVIKYQIKHLLKECGVLKSIDKHSFSVLELYLEACDSLIARHENPQPNNIINEMQSLVNKYPDNENYIPRLLEKLQLIMMGMDSLPMFDDDNQDLILQRGVVLATLLNGYDSFKSYRQNQKTGTIVESIARLLYISSNKLGHIPEKLWKPSKEDFFNFLNAADNVVSENTLTIKSTKNYEEDGFDSKESISINDITLSISIIKPAPEVEHAINRLRSLKYAPKRASEAKICVIKTLLDHTTQTIFVEPIDLKFLPQPQFKDNFKISLVLKDFAKVLNSKKTRNQFIDLAQKYMISFSISPDSNKDIEIARYQLSSTMDKDELEQHIELISIAAKEIQQSNE